MGKIVSFYVSFPQVLARFWWNLLFESLSTVGTPPPLIACTHLETVWYTLTPLLNSYEFIPWRTGELLFVHRNIAPLYRILCQNETAKALMLACKMHVHCCTSNGNIYKLHATCFQASLVHFPCCHMFGQKSKCRKVWRGPCIGLVNICYFHIKCLWYYEQLSKYIKMQLTCHFVASSGWNWIWRFCDAAFKLSWQCCWGFHFMGCDWCLMFQESMVVS